MRLSKLYVLFLALMQVIVVFGQNDNVRQLKKKAENAKGEEKIILLIDLSKAMVQIDPEAGIRYAEEGLLLAESQKKHSLKPKLVNAKGMNYWYLSDFPNAEKQFRLALKLAILYKDSFIIAKAYNNIGLIHEAKSEFDSCLIMFKKNLEILRKMKLYEETGTALENIGTIHLYRGEFKSAITYFLEAQKIYEKNNNAKSICYIMLKLGGIYSQTEDYEEAIKYYNEGIKLARENNEPNLTAIGLNSLGIIYKMQKKFDLALEKYFEAIELIKNLNNKLILMKIYTNIGNVYTLQNKFRSASDYHYKALKISRELNMPNEIAIKCVNLGEVYFFTDNFIAARKYYEEALTIFLSIKTYNNILSTYEALIKVNNKLKDYEQSVKYYDSYISLKDSLYKNEMNSALDSLKIMFNTEQTQLENKTLTQQNEIQDKTILIQKISIFASVAVIFLIILFTFSIIKSKRKIKLSNYLLEQKNKEITEQDEELRSINQHLKELSGFKDIMNSFLFHDLKTPLNTIININTHTPDEYHLLSVKNAGEQMLNMVMTLLDINKFESNKFQPNLKHTTLNPIINKVFNEVSYIASQKSIKIKVNGGIDYSLLIDIEIIERVFVNILNNAIKFSPNGDLVEINIKKAEDFYLQISVKDNGSGIEPQYLDKIFDRFSKIPSSQTGIKRSTGIGLSFCKMAVEAHGGKIGVISEPGKGSEFWFLLPLAKEQNNNMSENETQCRLETDNSFPDFTDRELKYLGSFYKEMAGLKIFQVTDIKEVLEKINNEFDSENINNWKNCILRAIENYDELRFNLLIKIISDE